MTTTHARLRIAARIHFFLLRELGHGIDVEGMLKVPSYAGEVLAMCDRARGTPLQRLGNEFREATAQATEAAGGHAGLNQPWAADTSGFGLTRPMPLA
jgi:hypothetical protein